MELLAVEYDDKDGCMAKLAKSKYKLINLHDIICVKFGYDFVATYWFNHELPENNMSIYSVLYFFLSLTGILA